MNAHLERAGIAAFARPHPAFPHRAMLHPKPRARWPRVTVIVPTKDAPQHLGRCLESIFSRSTYPNFGVLLVDNGTTDAEALSLFERYPVDVLPFDEPFNFSRANNARRRPRGRRARRVPQQRHRGADARVARGDGEPRRAGRGRRGRAAPPLPERHRPARRRRARDPRHGRPRHARLPGQRRRLRGLALVHEGGVGGDGARACSIRRDVFAELGGFDEHFATHYQDVDLCLRLRALGPPHPLHAARRPRPPRERHARRPLRPPRPRAPPRRLGRDDRPRRPVLQPAALALGGRLPTRAAAA